MMTRLAYAFPLFRATLMIVPLLCLTDQLVHTLLDPKATTCGEAVAPCDCSAALRAPTSMGSPSGVPVP